MNFMTGSKLVTDKSRKLQQLRRSVCSYVVRHRIRSALPNHVSIVLLTDTKATAKPQSALYSI